MISLMPQAADKKDDKADNAEIKLHLDKVAQTLKRIPYAEEGEGPTIYVIAYSTCPHARRFENDWRGKLGNVKMRYVLYGIDERTMSEAAALALSRDPADFHAFMANAKAVPSVYASNERIDAFNGIVDSLKNGIVPVLQANRYMNNIRSPHFFYTDGRRLLTQGGYSRESFADILKISQAGYAKAVQQKAYRSHPIEEGETQ
ncbi:MAG: hypothetical protein IV085_14230 [Thiobacillus sp.]|nr:hypothetical protein [Thiobacillus sp.]